MRRLFFLLLVLTLVTSGYYFLATYQPVCSTPFTYRLGEFDVRFNISREEAKASLLVAEAVWEEPAGRDLFTYDEEPTFLVNFIFDDRQERTLAEEAHRAALDTKEVTSADIKAQYTVLTETYATLEKDYTTKLAAYEKKLEAFNTTVANYNADGGAPKTEFVKLEAIKKSLEREARVLDTQSAALAKIAHDLNNLSDQGNRIIEQYNQSVQTYNKNFGHGGEFTQGDYQKASITIYKFSDVRELTTVLTHEFGHALGIAHVEGSSSIMYYLLEEQPKNLKTSPEDLAAFRAVCSENTGIIGTMEQLIKSIFK